MSNTFLLRGARLIDGTGAPPLIDAAVLVRAGRIQAVGRFDDFGESDAAGLERIDVGQQTILPGLINTHQHLDTRHGYGSYQMRAAQAVPYLVTRAVRNALLDLQEG
ncbi:MAG: amidohydrolase family protein, partial [Chloroflexota bacterium]|nr:amidohydrolase family protein [Chloroflexota bacterium]